jgi:hypothetical protein
MAAKSPKVISASVTKLIPYANNARTHSDAQVAQIAASIREFGWTNPILIDGDNNVIAGHGRLMAARKLALEEVPAIVLDHLSTAQRKALILADNKLALNSGWDDELLKVELADLHEADFDLGKMGFTAQELANLLGLEAATVDEDEPATFGAKYGVIVMCNDEAHQESVFNDLQSSGYEVKVVNV